jgi:tetratricopeptide (TPR) repeat protein
MNAILAALAVISAPHSGGQAMVRQRMGEIWGTALVRLETQTDKWFDDGDFPRCIQTFRLMTSIYPNDYEIATNLGWLLESTEEDNEALAAYIRYERDNPDDPDAPWPQANFYFKKKLYAKVPPLLEPTLKHRKNPHPNSFRLLAHSYEKLNLLRDSKRVWEKLLTITPEDEAAKRNLERVNRKLQGSEKL